ncbi:MAG: glycoside hydrolase family 38 C-terminal domain-containing protein [Polyangiaceae bacterium]
MTTGSGVAPRALFLATLPSLGTSVFTLIPGEAKHASREPGEAKLASREPGEAKHASTEPGEAKRASTELAVSTQRLENGRYRVELNEQGDIAQIFDKHAKRDVLSAPIRLSLHTEWPSAFPAWNMDWADRKQPPRQYVDAAPKIEILEAGPIRVAVRVERESAGSRFVQIFRLNAGAAGERLEIVHRIDWKTPGSSLKVALLFAFGAPQATYNWGLGTIERGNNDETHFEVPSHGFIDLTDRRGDYGATLLTGAKYGSDKPEDHVLRLTLLYTPVAADEYREQGTQDFGRHEFSFALVGHAGAHSKAWAEWQRRRFEEPLLAFRVEPHRGRLGRTFQFLSMNNPQIAVQALKRSEDGQRIVLRLRELEGKPGTVVVRPHSPFLHAWEMTGAEREIGELPVDDGTLRLSFAPNQLRTIAVRMREGDVIAKPSSQAIALPFDIDAISSNANRADGNFDGAGGSLPAEQLPNLVEQGGIRFSLGSAAEGQLNASTASGQRVRLPPGFSRLHVLMSSSVGVDEVSFTLGNRSRSVRVPKWTGYVGQWDRRVFQGGVPELSFSVDGPLLRVEPAFIDTTRVAWWASHWHRAPSSDLPYRFAYLFSYALELGEGARDIVLPRDPRVLIFAMSVSRNSNDEARVASQVWPDLARDEAFRRRFGAEP